MFTKIREDSGSSVASSEGSQGSNSSKPSSEGSQKSSKSSQASSKASKFPNSSHIELLRCPSCLLQSELMCPRCVCSHFRINRIREQYRELFLRKAEVCRKIEDELRPKVS